MNNSEKLKTVVDQFGKLSFLLETYVKLSQTGDCQSLLQPLMEEVLTSSQHLTIQISNLNQSNHE